MIVHTREILQMFAFVISVLFAIGLKYAVFHDYKYGIALLGTVLLTLSAFLFVLHAFITGFPDGIPQSYLWVMIAAVVIDFIMGIVKSLRVMSDFRPKIEESAVVPDWVLKSDVRKLRKRIRSVTAGPQWGSLSSRIHTLTTETFLLLLQQRENQLVAWRTSMDQRRLNWDQETRKKHKTQIDALAVAYKNTNAALNRIIDTLQQTHVAVLSATADMVGTDADVSMQVSGLCADIDREISAVRTNMKSVAAEVASGAAA